MKNYMCGVCGTEFDSSKRSTCPTCGAVLGSVDTNYLDSTGEKSGCLTVIGLIALLICLPFMVVGCLLSL